MSVNIKSEILHNNYLVSEGHVIFGELILEFHCKLSSLRDTLQPQHVLLKQDIMDSFGTSFQGCQIHYVLHRQAQNRYLGILIQWNWVLSFAKNQSAGNLDICPC